MIFSFLAIFHVLELTFLIFQLFQVSSPYFTCYNVCFSFSTFSLILPYSRSYCVHLSFFMFFNISRHISLPKECYSHFLWFSVFLPYSRSYSLQFSFFTFFSDLVIFQLLKCVFLIFHDFQFSCHIPCPRVYLSKLSNFFSFPRHISRPKVCISYFPWISVFLPYSRSYSVHFSFFTFHWFRHFSSRQGDFSHFPWFSVFLPYSKS